MGVDKYFRCYVNKDFLDQCRKLASEVSKDNPCTSCGAEKHHEIAYIGGVICHEAMHLLRTHHARAKANEVLSPRLAYLWNVAGDMEINDGLIEIFQDTPKIPNKLCLPPIQTEIDLSIKKTGVLLPQSEGYDDGKLCEEYFYRLKDKLEEMEKDMDDCDHCDGTGVEPGGDQGDGGGEEEGDQDGDQKGDGNGSGDEEGDEGSGGQGSGEKDGQGQGQPCSKCGGSGKEDPFGKSDCGSGADGLDRQYESGEPGPDNPQSGLSDIEGRMVRKDVAKEIRKAAKSRGNMPGGWERWADDELGVAKYNWRKELRKVVSRSMHTIPGDSLRSYKRLSRRCASIGHRAILPSTYDTRPVAAIVQDTSGSMGNDNLRISLEETQGILKAMQSQVTYINCDAQADKNQTVSKIRDVDLYGGGGTDMRVGIKAALESKPTPDVIFLFTDGWTPWPEHRLPRGKQLVVVLVGESACSSNEVPAWAKVVKVVEDVEVRQAG